MSQRRTSDEQLELLMYLQRHYRDGTMTDEEIKQTVANPKIRVYSEVITNGDGRTGLKQSLVEIDE